MKTNLQITLPNKIFLFEVFIGVRQNFCGGEF